MFAVIYRGYVKPEREEEYQYLWKKIASYFIEKRGANGSRLHKSEEGFYVAYSLWPDKETRDASWPGDKAPSEELPEDIKHAIKTIKMCIDQERKFPDICMHVVDDLL